MSSNPSPDLPDQPSFIRRHGCLVFLLSLVALFIVAVLLAWHVATGTAVPFRMFASMIQKANPKVHIEGITGDINSGIGISSITWGDVPGSPSEIRDLRMRYNGFSSAGASRRLVISEAGVSRAHIDIADLPSDTHTTTTQTTTVSSGGTTTSVTTTSSTGGITTTTSGGTTTTGSTSPFGSVSPVAPFPSGLDSFEIQRVSIEDVLITNRNNPDFRISIPKIEWTGFKATPKGVEAGQLTVESDRLNLHTTPGRTVPIEGHDVTFQKTLTGAAQPALHPAIKQPISFTGDLSFTPQGEVIPFHVVAADGKLEVSGTAEGGGSIHARQLDLAGFIDPRKIFGAQAAELPSGLVLNAVATPGFSDGSGSLKVIDGHFHLGVSTFQIQPIEFNKKEQHDTVLQAVLKADGQEIAWVLPLANLGDEYHPSFVSPGMEHPEILARVFTGRPYAELNAEEKQGIDARVPIYFPPAEK